MTHYRDIPGKSIFIILLLVLALIGIYRFLDFLRDYNLSADIETVYVDPEKIQIPDYRTDITDSIQETTPEEQTSFAFPSLMSSYNYYHKVSAFPIDELNRNSKDSLDELKKTLSDNLSESMNTAKERNLAIADIRNLSEINEFEDQARDLMKKQIAENTSKKLDTFLVYSAALSHKDIMNTEANREKESISYSEYMLNRNAYLNDFYLYLTNTERYRMQENRKAEDYVNTKFSEYEAENRSRIENQISNSGKIIKSLIENIKTKEKNVYFAFSEIETENIKADFTPPQKKSDFSPEKEKQNIDKKNIIISVATDNRMKVTFNKNSDLPDRTEEIQSLINRYGYLY
ncbi:MAG: hypothetical protein KBT47_01975 [Armatimonadetes bacterium]|nr:hypothetical protein [Candidatus Hippobium faecium]